MLKKEFTQYPHHTDPYAKHRITDEELDFLYELQKEMNTQHSDMLTYPRIWVIQEPIKNYLDNVETDLRNDPDAVEYLNQIADGADLCIDCINITTPQQLYQTIQSIIKDNSLEEKYQVELINNYKVLIHGKNDIGKMNRKSASGVCGPPLPPAAQGEKPPAGWRTGGKPHKRPSADGKCRGCTCACSASCC